ncbi:hypothetical protein GmHk_13G037759 [Glycine max]|nr:hypothetical protein GmHk_13G037759 [Glycine max]
MADNRIWQKAKIPPYKHAIAACGTAIVTLPSQIAYGRGRAREAITMDHQQQGAQHPRDANHPKGARSEDVNQGDMTLGNNHNQPL